MLPTPQERDMMRAHTPLECELRGEATQTGSIVFGPASAEKMRQITEAMCFPGRREEFEMHVLEGAASRVRGFPRDEWPDRARELVDIAKLLSDAYFSRQGAK